MSNEVFCKWQFSCVKHRCPPASRTIKMMNFNIWTYVYAYWFQVSKLFYLFSLDVLINSFKSLLTINIYEKYRDAKHQPKAIHKYIDLFSHHDKIRKTFILINERKIPMNKNISEAYISLSCDVYKMSHNLSRLGTSYKLMGQ